MLNVLTCARCAEWGCKGAANSFFIVRRSEIACWIYHNISVAHADYGQKKPAIFRSGLNNGVRNLRNQCRNQQERHPLSLAGKSVGGKKTLFSEPCLQKPWCGTRPVWCVLPDTCESFRFFLQTDSAQRSYLT